MDSYLDKAAAQVEKRSKGMNRAAGLIVKRLTRSKPPTPPTKLPERPPIATVKNGDVIDARDRFGKKPPTNEETDKYNVSEEGLRAWFGKSSGTTKSGRKVKGWVQVGGKYDGKPCARQPGQKSTPKCVSSSKRRSMSDNCLLYTSPSPRDRG